MLGLAWVQANVGFHGIILIHIFGVFSEMMPLTRSGLFCEGKLQGKSPCRKRAREGFWKGGMSVEGGPTYLWTVKPGEERAGLLGPEVEEAGVEL